MILELVAWNVNLLSEAATLRIKLTRPELSTRCSRRMSESLFCIALVMSWSTLSWSRLLKGKSSVSLMRLGKTP